MATSNANLQVAPPRCPLTNEPSRFAEHTATFFRFSSVQELLAGILILTVTFFLVICQPAPLMAQAQTTRSGPAPAVVLPAATAVSSSAPITVPAAIATGIGLAAAANIQISGGATWKGYEDIVVLAALDAVEKRAANTSQTLTSAQYSSIVNQIRSWLDGKKPANPVFADEAGVLRYAIDALVPLINAGPVNPLMAPVIGELENTKLTRLIPALNSGRQYPGNLILSTVSVYAFKFIGDTAEDASNLAHNDAQFAAAVNPVLFDLLGVDSSASYAQIASLFPNALPTLPASNSDGSFTVNPQDLITQYQTVISGVQSAVDSQLSKLESVLSSTPKASAHAVHVQAVSVQDSTASGCTAGTPPPKLAPARTMGGIRRGVKNPGDVGQPRHPCLSYRPPARRLGGGGAASSSLSSASPVSNSP